MKKSSTIFLSISALLSFTETGMAQTNFPNGLTFGSSGTTAITPFDYPGRNNLELSSYNGGLVLYSPLEEQERGNYDGGITLYGRPVSVVLTADGELTNPGHGTFAVWSGNDYFSTAPSAAPLFEINSASGTAAFTSTDVTITDGTLSVDGSQVLTESAASATYLPKGNVLNGGLLAMGGATASGTMAVAYGTTLTTASGLSSFASGWNANASAPFAEATGSGVTASGAFSTARGQYASASSAYGFAYGLSATASGQSATAIGSNVIAASAAETVIGQNNLSETPASSTGWSETDALFRIGNGTSPSTPSDAVTIRKSGQTTLTNKAWKSNPSNPLADPSPNDDARGEALVVDGHTILNGKVIISAAQGDISMGIFH